MPASPFTSGDHVIYRGVHTDESGAGGEPVIADLKPAIVVEHSAACLRLFTPAGTSTMVSRPVPSGRPKPWGPGEWELVASTWNRWNAVFHHMLGEWRSTWLLWSPSWEFLGWYVNLQEPVWQTSWGFDFRDLQLDIVVGPDRTWRWKDEADLQRSLDVGLISAATEARIRASASEAVASIEAAAPPFDDESASWRPAEPYPPLALPDSAERNALVRWSASDAISRFE